MFSKQILRAYLGVKNFYLPGKQNFGNGYLQQFNLEDIVFFDATC